MLVSLGRGKLSNLTDNLWRKNFFKVINIGGLKFVLHHYSFQIVIKSCSSYNA